MAEFLEAMQQWQRMCKSMQEKNMSCKEDCLLGNNPTCGELEYASLEEINNAETVIMKWAAEHPVVYPTWGEWFVEHGDLVDGWQNATNAAWMANTALSIFMKPIPADIAGNLGIEPKEDV